LFHNLFFWGGELRFELRVLCLLDKSNILFLETWSHSPSWSWTAEILLPLPPECYGYSFCYHHASLKYWNFIWVQGQDLVGNLCYKREM
jgi:hypothetical protein